MMTAIKKEDLEKRISEVIRLNNKGNFTEAIEILVPLHVELNKLLESYEISEKHKLTISQKEKKEEDFIRKKKDEVLSEIYKIERKSECFNKKILDLYTKYRS